MCHGMVAKKSTTTSLLALISHGIFFPMFIFSIRMVEGLESVCPQPPEPENGGYRCHPAPCKDPLTSDSVIEYLCAEGYLLKGDYKYLTCKNGKWNPDMEVTCRLSQAGVIKVFRGIRFPSWLMASRWLCPLTKKLSTAALGTAYLPRIHGYRLSFQKELSRTEQGRCSSHHRTTWGIVTALLGKTKSLDILDCVRLAALTTPRLF